jgi:hypothetical protein
VTTPPNRDDNGEGGLRLLPDNAQIAVVSLGGIGDDLVKLDIIRQLRQTLRALHPDHSLTFVGRSECELHRAFDFVDEWRYIPNRHVNDVSALIADEFDITFDLRYMGQVLRPGMRWQGDTTTGFEVTRFISDWVPTTLGRYSFHNDGRRLAWFLERVEPEAAEGMSLRWKTRGRPFVLVANGADAAFSTRLTKQLRPSTVQEICDYFQGIGCTPVLVGTAKDAMPDISGAMDLIGKTTLSGLLWLARRAAGVVACEGGVAHIASHVRARTAVFFGPTSAAFWGYPDNLNIEAGGKCPMRPCWFRTADWHTTCAADAAGLVESPHGYPDCVSHFDIGEVGPQMARHFQLSP